MNQPRSRGPIAGLFIGLWDAVNFSRRLVFNLLFLLVLFVLLAAMLGGGKLAPLAERSTLVIAPEGRLVEQYSCDPVSRAFARATNGDDCREIRLRDLLRGQYVWNLQQHGVPCFENAPPIVHGRGVGRGSAWIRSGTWR